MKWYMTIATIAGIINFFLYEVWNLINKEFSLFRNQI